MLKTIRIINQGVHCKIRSYGSGLSVGTYLYNIVTQETDDNLTNGIPYGEWLTAKLAEINWSLASA